GRAARSRCGCPGATPRSIRDSRRYEGAEEPPPGLRCTVIPTLKRGPGYDRCRGAACCAPTFTALCCAGPIPLGWERRGLDPIPQDPVKDRSWRAARTRRPDRAHVPPRGAVRGGAAWPRHHDDDPLELLVRRAGRAPSTPALASTARSNPGNRASTSSARSD